MEIMACSDGAFRANGAAAGLRLTAHDRNVEISKSNTATAATF
jgi:hypothetical protein